MDLLFFLKLLIAIVFVVGLSLIAENVSPKIAGILSGYPTGSAITLFFFGLEVNPEFAAKSALYNMVGLTGALSFVLAYYMASRHIKKYPIFFSSICAIVTYLLIVWILHHLQEITYWTIILPVTFSFFCIYFLKNIENLKIKKKVKLGLDTLIIRAFFAALIILSITMAPNFFGPEWSGLFSAFPTTLFPLIVIIHYSYSKEHVHTIIKNVPIGMFSLIIYSLTVSMVYPTFGIYWGTLLSFASATVYLLFYSVAKKYYTKKRVSSLHKL
ncbi:hypothetical protein [Cytophaga sp. FL35]|uniref:hypothetical protein n=1 Tax=Cytophaga sp. FL35 TaxID=1904456 RepID=UPI0016534369|nr:hypothetical protein [Cytophaga sp. FL35]MBC7000286.1 hypothetical protein [Cytophaga sp. FL35]